MEGPFDLQFDLQLPRRDFILNLQGRFNENRIGIYGPSGAGKTSFFSLLSGLEKPEKGQIILNGRVLNDGEKGIYVPIHDRRIGVVFQEKMLFPHLSIRENLLFGTAYGNKSPLSLDDVVELLDLSLFLDSKPSQVSGGEQQRTAIGRALLSSPDMLLLDEPFSAVDSSLRSTILPYLKKLANTLDIPMLVISHDLSDIKRLTNSVYLIEKGQSVGYGNINTLTG